MAKTTRQYVFEGMEVLPEALVPFVPAFAPAHGAQLVASQGEGEGLGGDGLLGVGDLDVDQMIGAPCLLLGGPELEQ